MLSQNPHKWNKIIRAFENDQIEDLLAIQRTGSRGRIFLTLVQDMLNILKICFKSEPVFKHKQPDPWYQDFTTRHGLKLRVHEFYNPDFLLEDGTWLEATLSENTAYKKLFRHGHQAQSLTVIWLDEDMGLHKQVCQGLSFPNALVRSVKHFYPQLRSDTRGAKIIDNLERLKSLKGIVL
ncbi:MAG: hypothetical protein ACE5IR_15720 [bacterium]